MSKMTYTERGSGMDPVEAGCLVRRLQEGEKLSMPHSRPMPSIGAGCHELRILDCEVTWRIFYRLDEDAVVICGVLAKKSESTPTEAIRLCKQRLKRYDQAIG